MTTGGLIDALRLYEITVDDLWPRDADHRYRVYGRRGEDLHVLAACADAGGIGLILVTLHNDQKQVGARLADLGQIGVLDTIENDWIVLPWNRGQR